MKATIKDVARLANVSPATVSLVMNNKPGVNLETRQLVRDAIAQLEYKPNSIARSLSTRRSSTIGLIVTNIENPFFGELVHLIQKEMDKTHYNLLLGISSDQVEKEKTAIESMISRDVEGIIIVPARDGEHDLSHLQMLRELKIPFVFVTTAYRGIKADCIMTDLEQATFELTTHLLNTGERKIYFITETRSLLLSSERLMGYLRAFQMQGLESKQEWIIETNPTIENGIQITEEILKREKPDAIITVNEILALGVMKCLKERNILIPKQIAVASFDDLAYSSVLYTPLTTVKQPMEKICKIAVESICERANGNEMPYKIQLIQGELIVRDSSKHEL